MAQIINITSEALQSTIRRLLPSQQGFGEDLQAQNVVVPIIDLTPTAEGSSVPEDLRTAIGFSDITEFDVVGTSTTIINAPGFYRVTGTMSVQPGSLASTCAINFSDGLSTKQVYGFSSGTGQTTASIAGISFDIVLFVQAGESISVQTGNDGRAIGTSRQIASVNGVLSNPSGFNPQ